MSTNSQRSLCALMPARKHVLTQRTTEQYDAWHCSNKDGCKLSTNLIASGSVQKVDGNSVDCVYRGDLRVLPNYQRASARA